MTRNECLTAAAVATSGKRESDYGKPENNFGMIAALWSDYMCTHITAVDVAMMMALLKVARVRSGNGSDDSYVDIAGYAACACEINGKNKTRRV